MREDLTRQDTEDVRALLGTPAGARFFCRLLDECGVERISYIPGDPDGAFGTVYREGMRNAGLWLLGQIRALGGDEAIMRAREERIELFDRFERGHEDG